ncbi:hypothetical protein DY000_02003850 [Brassica cretica]|uniref:K Homology domain-containing protein n=1 Tax=Brassica cretica TaxID=69181 RepID=A0ABQ7BUL4_BRACR|nr:hypothetical protein DY000_02003850 [Brassica cretica]
MSMKLSEDFTKKLGFSEEGEEIRKLERSWSKLEGSLDLYSVYLLVLGGNGFVGSHVCKDALYRGLSVSSLSRYSVFLRVFWIERAGCDDECVILVTATESMAVEAILLLQERINDDDEETVKMQLLVPSRVIGCVIGRSGSVITQIRKRTNASIRISKGDNDDLVEVIMILTKVQIFSPSPFVSSVPEYASVDFDQRRETGESSLGMVSSDRFYGYESSFPARGHGLVSVSPYSYGG